MERGRESREAYTGFAEVYDRFMDNVPYGDWADYLAGKLEEHGVKSGLVAELGCGTGNLSMLMAEKGYDMIGIDRSEDMLAVAREKQMEAMEAAEAVEVAEDMEAAGGVEAAEAGDSPAGQEKQILYLCQDMREFELYGTVDAVLSVCDSLNYILEEEELRQVFSLVNNYLEERGIFIFDINTVYKYRHVLAGNTIAENREDCAFIWDNFYDEETGINEYEVSFYLQEEGDLFRRYQETHYQRGYDLATVKRLLEEAGMEFLEACDAATKGELGERTERLYVVAREGRQEGKLYRNLVDISPGQ